MNLQDKVTAIKGIGPGRTVALNKLNIRSVEDFLFFYPRDYEDRRELRNIITLRDGDTALVKGTLLLIVKGRGRIPRKQTLKLLVQDETGAMEVVFFHAGFLEKTLKQNEEYLFYGKASRKYGQDPDAPPRHIKVRTGPGTVDPACLSADRRDLPG